jgi:hypothetical protein
MTAHAQLLLARPLTAGLRRPYASEAATNDRNRGIAHLLDGYGRMYCDPDLATGVYTRQCRRARVPWHILPAAGRGGQHRAGAAHHGYLSEALGLSLFASAPTA